MKKALFLIALVSLLAGCATVEVSKVAPGSQEEGVRYYLPHPYLLVTEGAPPVQEQEAKTPAASASQKKANTTGAKANSSASENSADKDKKSQATSGSTQDDAKKVYVQLIWLPDMSKEYAVTPKSGLGTVNSSMQLKDGWQLTQFGGNVDTKVPETITAVTGLLTKLAPLFGAEEAGAPTTEQTRLPIEPGLYRLRFDEKSGMVNEIVGPIPFGNH